MPKKYDPPNQQRMYTIMSVEDAANGKKSQWHELEIKGGVQNLSPQLFRLQHLTTLHLNDNCLTRVPSEICYLQNLIYLDVSSNNLRTLPAEMGEVTSLRELVLNKNRLRNLPFELGKLFQLENLGLKGNPLAPELMNIYNEPNGMSKLLSYMLDHLVVNTTAPPQRQWIPLAHPERSRPSAIFTVMCYNVLCDKYCTRQQYGYCPSWALKWERRKIGILEELRQYNADIVSLQEIETDQFYNYFLPELKANGYDGIFSPKSRARTMTEQERKHVDGCAIFYQTSKFSLIKEHLIEFNQLAMANAEGSDDMLNRVMPKDNIGIAAFLQTKEPYPSSADQSLNNTLLVVNSHFHWDPEFCDVKLIQTLMLIKELRMIIESYLASVKPLGHPYDINDVPLVLCGDLNSTLDSGVIEYLDKGKISSTHIDFKERGYETYLQNFSNPDTGVESLSHNFRLSRAYDNGIMTYTNYTYDFKGIIDYIFYSRDTMRCLGVLGAVDNEWFKQNKVIGCPNPHIPSDHFSLFIELELSQTYPNRTTLSSGLIMSKLR